MVLEGGGMGGDCRCDSNGKRSGAVRANFLGKGPGKASYVLNKKSICRLGKDWSLLMGAYFG